LPNNHGAAVCLNELAQIESSSARNEAQKIAAVNAIFDDGIELLNPPIS
jgi:hypothetical protein